MEAKAAAFLKNIQAWYLKITRQLFSDVVLSQSQFNYGIMVISIKI